jgi:ADP-ribose pyrophosphatase YjhB (NUDIX family)
MFHYCPSCASSNIRFEYGVRFSCPDCGFVYFHNNAAATGCIISTDAGILFVVRAKDPGKGKLGVPGGFINPGENAVEGVRRECIEEIGWDPGPDVKFFASFPNIYPYKGVGYNTCDLYFAVSVPRLSLNDLKLDPKETEGIRFIKLETVNLDELAFDSARNALRAFLRQSY